MARAKLAFLFGKRLPDVVLLIKPVNISWPKAGSGKVAFAEARLSEQQQDQSAQENGLQLHQRKELSKQDFAVLRLLELKSHRYGYSDLAFSQLRYHAPGTLPRSDGIGPLSIFWSPPVGFSSDDTALRACNL